MFYGFGQTQKISIMGPACFFFFIFVNFYSITGIIIRQGVRLDSLFPFYSGYWLVEISFTLIRSYATTNHRSEKSIFRQYSFKSVSNIFVIIRLEDILNRVSECYINISVRRHEVFRFISLKTIISW